MLRSERSPIHGPPLHLYDRNLIPLGSRFIVDAGFIAGVTGIAFFGHAQRCDVAMTSSYLETSRLRADTWIKSLAIIIPRKTIMAIQIVMDSTGDSRHFFNPDDARELAKAERRFYELTAAGFTAAIRTGPGQVSQMRSFDPNAEETVFFPRLVGG